MLIYSNWFFRSVDSFCGVVVRKWGLWTTYDLWDDLDVNDGLNSLGIFHLFFFETWIKFHFHGIPCAMIQLIHWCMVPLDNCKYLFLFRFLGSILLYIYIYIDIITTPIDWYIGLLVYPGIISPGFSSHSMWQASDPCIRSFDSSASWMPTGLGSSFRRLQWYKNDGKWLKIPSGNDYHCYWQWSLNIIDLLYPLVLW